MIEPGCVCFSDKSTPTPACLLPGNATVDKLEDFINNINSVLESLYIEIKKGITEDDGRPIYALVCEAVPSCGILRNWRRGLCSSSFLNHSSERKEKGINFVVETWPDPYVVYF